MNAGTVTTERRAASTDRRQYTLRTAGRAVSDPRRQRGRRTPDRNFAVLDRVEPAVGWMAIALVTLSIFDAIFTLTLISRGGSELNPFMDHLLGFGVAPFVAVKMVLTAVPALILVATGNLLAFGRVRARSVLAALVGFYAGLIVYEIGLLSLL